MHEVYLLNNKEKLFSWNTYALVFREKLIAIDFSTKKKKNDSNSNKNKNQNQNSKEGQFHRKTFLRNKVLFTDDIGTVGDKFEIFCVSFPGQERRP